MIQKKTLALALAVLAASSVSSLASADRLVYQDTIPVCLLWARWNRVYGLKDPTLYVKVFDIWGMWGGVYTKKP